jgi:hypothetical protein
VSGTRTSPEVDRADPFLSYPPRRSKKTALSACARERNRKLGPLGPPVLGAARQRPASPAPDPIASRPPERPISTVGIRSGIGPGGYADHSTVSGSKARAPHNHASPARQRRSYSSLPWAWDERPHSRRTSRDAAQRHHRYRTIGDDPAISRTPTYHQTHYRTGEGVREKVGTHNQYHPLRPVIGQGVARIRFVRFQ